VSQWQEWTRAQLDAVERSGQWRSTRVFDALDLHGRIDGQEVINFAANDYLGLSMHPDVCAAAVEAIERFGTGSGAARLVTGTRSLHADLEGAIAEWKGTPRALVFPTGYAANIGVLTALSDADTTIFSDQLNHASIVDGCRLAKASTVVFAHNDLAQLEQRLQTTLGRKIVVTESIFSMDGDAAPVTELAVMCSRHRALLVLDEAHAVFGSPLSAHLPDLDYVLVGTLSKTLGSLGGWVAASAAVIDLLVNRARTFIFTTGSSPPDTAAALAALQIYRSTEGEQLRRRLRGCVDAIRPGHPSPIMPIVLGSEEAAVAASKALIQHGIYIPAIRPPTVPHGTSRLRLTFSAAHTDDMIEQLKAALTAVNGVHASNMRAAR
jgi:8-amino-7-oxononanoate synthase